MNVTGVGEIFLKGSRLAAAAANAAGAANRWHGQQDDRNVEAPLTRLRKALEATFSVTKIAKLQNDVWTIEVAFEGPLASHTSAVLEAMVSEIDRGEVHWEAENGLTWRDSYSGGNHIVLRGSRRKAQLAAAS